MRRALLLVLATALLAAPAAHARQLDGPVAVASTRQDGGVPPGAWGGAFTTRTGETVHVFLSPSYPVDTARAQQWADFLDSLVHGPELSLLTLYLAPADEVTAFCGRGALACYLIGSNFLVAPADDPGNGLSAKAVIAHEYGHHIAANRVNPPWNAAAWGTKRWGTYVGVCRGVRRHRLFPGAESSLLYTLNPGEAFAEDYRVLNERLLGLPESPWQVVDDSLKPDATALRLLQEDVTQPWRQPPPTRVAATLRRGTRTFALATAEDGTVTARVQTRGGLRVRTDFLVGGKRVARGATSLRYIVCGTRKLTIRVTRVAGAGSLALTVSKP